MNESNLHSALKKLYTNAAEEHELCINGFIVDIVRDGSIIEIQTGSFSKINKKLTALLPDYRVKLVYPIACEKTLLVYDHKKENILYRRKSPKKVQLLDIMDELIYIPKHAGNLYLNLSRKGYYLNWAMSFTGKRYTQPGNEDPSFEVVLNPYSLHDLYLGKSFKIGKSQAGLQLVAYNIFNISYQAVLSRPMPIRNFAINLRWEL